MMTGVLRLRADIAFMLAITAHCSPRELQWHKDQQENGNQATHGRKSISKVGRQSWCFVECPIFNAGLSKASGH
jgi:hypothetical protein